VLRPTRQDRHAAKLPEFSGMPAVVDDEFDSGTTELARSRLHRGSLFLQRPTYRAQLRTSLCRKQIAQPKPRDSARYCGSRGIGQVGDLIDKQPDAASSVHIPAEVLSMAEARRWASRSLHIPGRLASVKLLMVSVMVNLSGVGPRPSPSELYDGSRIFRVGFSIGHCWPCPSSVGGVCEAAV
jgi:hypothetical protein